IKPGLADVVQHFHVPRPQIAIGLEQFIKGRIDAGIGRAFAAHFEQRPPIFHRIRFAEQYLDNVPLDQAQMPQGPDRVIARPAFVPVRSAVNLYCTWLAAGYDMNIGPQISSSVGGLMTWMWPQKWPALFPVSRSHRPPGQASSLSGIGLPSGIRLSGPSSAST